MRAPLWFDLTYRRGRDATVTLSRCRNCGKTKVASRPCGFDHLAALMEFRAALPSPVTPNPTEQR